MDRQTKRTSTAPKLVLEPVRESSRLESHPLAAGRYLIGSSPECDIVITMGGVAPQHCLMIVGANKTIVKAISQLTWINDGPLTEAVLKHGERLILGPVELRTRRPEVSEWIERREPEPAPAPAAVSYEPPQIEELLDHARQQLQSAIDDEVPSPPETWADELSLADAVQLHSEATEAESVSPAPVPESELLLAAQRELQQQELEIAERSRALEDIGTELSSREAQLRSRESALNTRQTQVEQWLTEFEQRQQTLTAQEQALQVRSEAEATASQMIAEMTRSLEGEQLRLRQQEESVHEQATELERQALALAERTQELQSQEIELLARAAALEQQAPVVQTLAAALPVDTSEVELREAAVAQREAILTSSLAALQVTREQISDEAAELEQRFTELLQREQSARSRESTLAEQTSQAEVRIREATALTTTLTEREQAVTTSLASVTERDAHLQQRRTEIDGRERELRGLRSELDIREESLNQQFSQLQLDRSALRAAQSKLQQAEQSANQRLADLDWSAQQRTTERDAEWEQGRQKLAAQSAEWEAKASELQEQTAGSEARQLELESLAQDLAAREQALVNSATELASEREQWLVEQQHSLEQAQAALAAQAEPTPLLSPAVDRTEIDNEWQSLAAERARIASERRELDEAIATAQAEKPDAPDSDIETTEVSSQLQALVSERQSLAQLREELLQEQQELRAEREVIRRSRDQFDQDHEQLLAIKAESATERDTYLLERQGLISERQSLNDRDRQIQKAEAEVEQTRLAAAQIHTEAETTKHQMTTQRVHLDEEWASLRQERAEHKRAQAELDVQRDELTLLAQQLSDVQAEESQSEPIVSILSPPVPVIEESPVAHVETVEEEDSDMEAPDPLAGFASFSSIGAGIDDDLPPAIASLLRKSTTSVTPPVDLPVISLPLESVTTTALDSGNALIDDGEEQRLLDLLGRSSESFVDAAVANVGVDTETYEVVDDEVESETTLATEWDGDTSETAGESLAEDDFEQDRVEPDSGYAKQRRDTPHSLHDATDRPARPEPPPASADLRSRLSDMFGIDLGQLRQPGPHPTEDAQSSSEELIEEEEQAPLEDNAEPVAEEQLAEAEQDSEAEDKIDESLDPVAAYMEQLLARTRKSRDSGHAKAEPVAPKPATPVAVREESLAPQIAPPAPEPVRPPRKTEPVDKEAMRANLDSFRSIANTRARSDVARSELRRLKITEKLKQVFLAISAGIALILVSTELWTTRRYRLEMSAALLATAFLGWDYYRTQKRLRELQAIAPPELDTPDEGDESDGE